MKTLDTIDKAQLIAEYKVTNGFVRRHGRAMGGIGKPMIWDRARVEAYLDTMMSSYQSSQYDAQHEVHEINHAIKKKVRTITSARSLSFSADMQGRGGRQS